MEFELFMNHRTRLADPCFKPWCRMTIWALCFGGLTLLTGCFSLTRSWYARGQRFDAELREFTLIQENRTGTYLGVQRGEEGNPYYVYYTEALLDPEGGRALQIWIPAINPKEVRARLLEVELSEPEGPAVTVRRHWDENEPPEPPDQAEYPAYIAVDFITAQKAYGECIVSYLHSTSPGAGKLEFERRIAWAEVDLGRVKRSGSARVWRSFGYLGTVPTDIILMPLQLALHFIHLYGS